ncbi:hypothetical protein BCR33DRAFT_714524 [Rhizoclosmatium globosum]|uniref:MARVEL domain-containing protein n=1 Tax=Rhizoclosmatium globosum TaxID=329046 RepID=A0A1Y2CMA4_9FUNG|nr:hypothetical protein BCR33DRAFT_714524 [Rhizoclosmatium globosum]|eukprot:ORY48087.1 hypothetical protein BCR33DRAFT_714524 [Rhizoclosmatium globosum]
MLPLPNLKSLGMKRSGSGGGLLSSLKGNKQDYADKFNKNFEIEKKVRFSNRFFQVALAMISYYFLGQIAGALADTHPGLYQTIGFNWMLAIMSPIIAGALVGQYFAPFCITNWTSVKMLSLELLLDLTITIFWIGCFASEIQLVNGDCPPGKSYGCDMFNWTLAWNILSFLSWLIAVGLDVHSLLLGLGYIQPGHALEDMELNASIMRRGRMG